MSWKKGTFRILAGIVALLLVVLVGGCIFVHTRAFRRFVINKIAEKTQQSTGEQLRIGKMEIHWSELKVDLYDLVLRKPSMSPPPFFSCAHLAVSVRILSLWRRRFALDEVVVDRPLMHIVVTPQGQTNLPHSANTSGQREAPQQATSPSSSAAQTIFSVGIRHLVITSGEFDWNDQKYPASADLRDLRATAQLNVSARAYRGSLAYDHGRVSAPHVLPFEHSLHMEFVATRAAFDVTALRVATGGTRASFQGTVVDYVHPRVQGVYQAVVFTPDLARTFSAPSIPSGEVRISGSLRYESQPHKSFLEAIYAKGRMDAPRLLAHLANVSVEARRVRADYVLENGDMRLPDIAGQALGGSLDANFSMRGLAGRREAQLNGQLRGASLADLMRFDRSWTRERLGLAGTTSADVQATWTGTFSHAAAHVRARIYGPLRPLSRRTIPVNGFLDVRYDGPRDSATFAPSSLRTENANISFQGKLGNNSSLSVNASVGKLSEISPLISAMASSTQSPGSSAVDSLGLRGSATFLGRIQGSPKSPRIRGRLEARTVFVKGTYLSAVRADVDLGASELSIQNASAKDAGKGSLALSGRLGLRNWSLVPTSPVSLQVNASGLSVPDLARMANVKYHLSGTLDADISVHGSEENPAGYADISVSEASPQNPKRIKKLLPLRKFLTVHLEGDGNLVHATARMSVAAGQISAKVAYAPKAEHYDGQINAASLDLSKIQLAQQRGATLAGVASFSVTGNGTIKHPEAAAILDIPTLQIEGETVSALRAQLGIQNEQLNFAVNSTVKDGYVQAKGEVALRGNYPTTASLDVRSLPVGPLLANHFPSIPEDLQCETEMHAKLSGPLKDPQQIKAQIQVPTLNVSYRTVHLDLAAPMNLYYADGLVSVRRTQWKGNGTNLIVRGTVPIKSTQPLDVSANGSIDLDLLQGFGNGISSSGRLILDVVARGSISHPTMHGQIQIASATFLSATLPIGVESLNGKIRVAGTRLEIEQLAGTLGGGSLSATGFLEYGSHPSFNLVAQAKSVRVRYPTGLRAVLNGDLNLTGSSSSSSLTGRVQVDRLSFTQQFDMATLMGEFGSQVPSTGLSPFAQHMKLNVAIASSSGLDLASSKLSIGGNFALTVSGTAANPVILGRIALTQGEVFFLGKRYEIQSGTIEFASPVRTEPVLNIYAKTTVNQYSITLNFVGPIDRLRTNYTSTPPLSEADIIHMIAFGTTAEQAATSPSAPASVAAESILAQGVSSQVSGKLEKLTGISQITIDPLVTNSQANPGSQIAIQERISGSLLLSFSTSVTNTQADTVEVQYTTPQNIRISVLRDYNGGYALDLRFRKTF
jgi:translocation and assembly module TamB